MVVESEPKTIYTHVNFFNQGSRLAEPCRPRNARWRRAGGAGSVEKRSGRVLYARPLMVNGILVGSVATPNRARLSAEAFMKLVGK
jgi:hypothetical protein